MSGNRRRANPIRYYQDAPVEAMPPHMTSEERAEFDESVLRIRKGGTGDAGD